MLKLDIFNCHFESNIGLPVMMYILMLSQKFDL